MMYEAEIQFKRGDFGDCRNSIFSECQESMKNGDYQASLQQIAWVIYIDLSGLWNDEYEMETYLCRSEVLEGMLSYLPSRDFPFMIPPFVMGDLTIIQDQLGLSDDELAERLMAEFDKIKLPRHLFYKDECVQITMAEMYEKKTKLREIYATAKRRLKGIIKDLKTTGK